MRTNIPRNNFSSGIVSQQLSGRVDLPAFQNGVSFLENFVINLNGSISKRTGFALVGKNNDNTGESYFIRFVFNQEQVYLLEFRRGYFVVWLHREDNRLVLYNNGQQFDHSYQMGDVKNLKYSQNHDVIYFCHGNYPPRMLTRTYGGGMLNFTFSDVVVTGGSDRENPFTIDGNPSCGVFYQNRMVYGGFAKTPNKLWASDRGYYDQFTTKRSDHDDIMEIDGFNFVLTELSLPILWITPTTNGLVLGTAHGLAIVMSDTGQLTPFSFACSLVNDDGCSANQPIVVGTTLIYIDSTLKRLKAFNYAYNTNSYESVNLNILCPELIDSSIRKIVYNQDENDFVYVLTEDGNLYYLLYSSIEQFYAWGRLRTYARINNIESLERYDGGTNLFLMDDRNNILRKYDNIIFKRPEEFLSISKSNRDLHERYYDYLQNVTNELCYLDYSQEIYYHRTSTVVYRREQIDDEGEFGTITGSQDDFSESSEELLGRTLHTRMKSELGELEHGEFEIREKLTDSQIRVRVLSKDLTRNTINDWSFNKNKLDGFDSAIYEDGNGYSIVGDGYSADSVTIQDRKILLPQGIYLGHFWIGLGYSAVLRTMNLGGMIDMTNTMVMKKNIIKVYFRLYNSWGGKFGTDYFNLKDINYQKIEYARYGEPYTLEDRDVKIESTDRWEFSKYYYILQDRPYPFNVNSITLSEEQT
jgi:hypothetical protein